jgi:hypothetical protein
MPTNPAPSSVSATEALLTLVAISLLAFPAVSYLVPPAAVPATAPASEFSAERAIEHLKVIAREPHPTGSMANARVRDYIVEQLKSFGAGTGGPEGRQPHSVGPTHGSTSRGRNCSKRYCEIEGHEQHGCAPSDGAL